MQVVSDSLNNFTQATLNNFLRSKCLNYAMKLKKVQRSQYSYEKHQQLHKYLINLDENLDTSSFGPAEQLYLDPKS